MTVDRKHGGIGLSLALALLGILSVAALTRAQFTFPFRFSVLDPIELSVGDEVGVQAFTLADIDLDNSPDLIAINQNQDRVSVLLNQGDGTFAELRDFDIGGIPTAVAVADVSSPGDAEGDGDADGNPDILVVDEFGRVVLFLGLGDGDFVPSDQELQPGQELVGVAVGDFDGTDPPDLAVLDSADVVYFLCNTSGTFEACSTGSVGTQATGPIAIDVGDFDGDTNLDVVVLSQASRDISLIFGNGDGSFEDVSFPLDATALDTNTPVDLVVTRLNLDDDLDDIVVVNFENNDLFGVVRFLGRENRNLNKKGSVTPFLVTAVAAADFDDDGAADIIVGRQRTSSQGGAPVPIPGDGAGDLSDDFAPAPGTSNIGAAIDVEAADLDGDGLPDFVVLLADGGRLLTAINVSDEVTPTPDEGTPPETPVATDTPGPTGTPTPTVPTNTPTPSPTATPIPKVPLSRCDIQFGDALDAPVAVGSGDFNGDGKVDVVAADRTQGRVVVWLVDPFELPPESEGCTVQAEAQVIDVPGIPRALAVGQLNVRQDRSLDLALVGSGGVTVLFGDGAGGFGDAATIDVGTDPWAVAIHDLDFDGKHDVVVANRASSTVAILYGGGDKTFENPVMIGVPNPPTSVVVGDVNGDTFPDIAIASIDGRSVHALLRERTSPRGYQPTEPTTLAGSPTSLVAATFTNDGMTDLAASVRATDGSGTFVVLIAALNGDELRFLPSSTLSTGRRPSAIGAANFGGDVTPDVVVANSADDTVTFYVASAGQFSTPLDPALVNAGPAALTIADFDLDGTLDVVTADEIAGRLTLLRSRVPPSTPTPTRTGTNTQTPTITTTPTVTDTPEPPVTGTPTPRGTPTRTPIPSRTPTNTTAPTPKQGIFELSGAGVGCSVTDPPTGSWHNAFAVWALVVAGIIWRRHRSRRPSAR